MLSHLNKTKAGIIIASSGFISFSIADACAKWLGEYYEILNIIFWTYYISLIIGLFFSPFLGGIKKTIATKRLHIHIGRGICALGIALSVVSALKGENALPLATLYTILFLAPFLISIAAIPIYKEKVPFKNWFIIALGFLGILIAFKFGLADLSINILYAFAALFFIVGLSILARPLCNKESLLSLSLYPNITILLLLNIFASSYIELPKIEHFPIFMLNGLCVTIGLSAIAYGFRIAPFSIIAPIHYIQMVVAIVLGYIIFGDIPDLWMIIGASIIIISGLMLIFNKKHH